MLSEFDRGGVGCVTGLREEDVEHQTTAGGQGLSRQREDGAQLLRRPKIRDHLGEQDQLIVPTQIIGGGEDVAVDHAHIK